MHTPREDDAFHHLKVLHEHIPVWLLGQAAHRVGNAQLDGIPQGRGWCLVEVIRGDGGDRPKGKRKRGAMGK